MAGRTILLCTVGTSLLNPKSAGGPHTAWPDGPGGEPRCDWAALAADLAKLAPTDRAAGAEVNAVAALVAAGLAAPGAGVYLFHSDTPAGHGVAEALAGYFAARGHAPAEAVAVADLQDADPQRFAADGLPNLARRMAAVVRAHGPAACAINATGGYKAQAAVAAMAGAALGVPVYYLHERFGAAVELPRLTAADLGAAD